MFIYVYYEERKEGRLLKKIMVWEVTWRHTRIKSTGKWHRKIAEEKRHRKMAQENGTKVKGTKKNT